MRTVPLGTDWKTGQDVRIPRDAFRTHFHLIGGTGKGKTTAIHAMLHRMLPDPEERACWIIVDRLGNLSTELLLWMSSPFCPEHVRRRLVYVQPSREDRVIPFNPLVYTTRSHGYYKVSRATDIMLRAWESVNIEAMPRLARWTFNAFWAAAQLGLTIADCVHFLLPASSYHKQLLQCLPDALRWEWDDLLRCNANEIGRLLESTRNRLKPYFESDILRWMFGSTESRLDVLEFMRGGRIVLLNLAPMNRLTPQLGDAIGSLVLNEVLAVARSLPLGVRYPTYLLLDEFQNFVGPDIEGALPEVRQLGIRLILSHQSLSQLKRGDYDLTTMIFQAQSRMVFGLQGEDADLLAQELASLTYDPRRIKDEIYSRRQLVTGHKIIELTSHSSTSSHADNWNKTYGTSRTDSENFAPKDPWGSDLKATGKSTGDSEGKAEGGSSGWSETSGTAQHMQPVYEQFLELASRTYFTFEEQKNEWARDIRQLRTGATFLRLVNDPRLYAVNVKRSAVGYLAWNLEDIARRLPRAIDGMHRLIEENQSQDLFVSPQVIEREAEARLEKVVRGELGFAGGNPAAVHDDSFA